MLKQSIVLQLLTQLVYAPDAMGAQSDRLRCFDVCLQIIEKHDGLWRGDLSAFECEPEDRRIGLHKPT